MNKHSQIRLSKSVLGPEEQSAVKKVLDDEYLGMGTWVKDFEERISEYLDNKPVVMVNSGTAALHLALMAIGLTAGDEVLVPSLTYLASFQAISATGATPIACDVHPDTGLLDLNDAASRLTKHTKAIMPVDFAGRPCDYDQIIPWAKDNGLRIIQDAAHAFGSTYQHQKVGTMGDITCFSFDGIKNITSGEGGCIVTEDTAVLQWVKDARLLGVQHDTDQRYKGERSWEFEVTHQGFRYHMSNIMAALGIAQFDKLESRFKPARQQLAKRYHEQLQGIEGITLFPNDYDRIVPHIFPIQVLNGKRDALRTHLIDANIECGIHYYPNHKLHYYHDKSAEPLTATEHLYESLLSIPIHPDLNESDVDYIVSTIQQFLNTTPWRIRGTSLR